MWAIGVGAGRVQLTNTDPAPCGRPALCDINPTLLARADEILAAQNVWLRAIMSSGANAPEGRHRGGDHGAAALMHAEIASGCSRRALSQACEKMMAGSSRLRAHDPGRAETGASSRSLTANYNPIYQAAHDGIVKAGVLGDVPRAPRVASQRRLAARGEPPSKDYDPRAGDKFDLSIILNWRLH